MRIQLYTKKFVMLSGMFLVMSLLAGMLTPVGFAHASFLDSLVPCSAGENEIRVSSEGDYWVYKHECTICHLQVLAQRILNFLVAISVAVAALLFANAGFLYVTSSANPSNIGRAHHIFTNTLLGILLILVAWLLIDTVMKTLLDTGKVNKGDNTYGPWNEILCSDGQDYEEYKIKKIGKMTLTPTELVLKDIGRMNKLCSDFGGTCSTVKDCASPNNIMYGNQALCPDRGPKTCCVPPTAMGACNGKGICMKSDSPLCSKFEASSECSGGLTCCVSANSGAGGGGNPDGKFDCNDVASLKEEFGGAGPVNAHGLDSLVACYRNDPGVQKYLSGQAVYTYDHSHSACNYTNGKPACGPCSHSENSCHYGRGTGQGAMAADFNGTNESMLYDAIQAARAKCGGRILFEGDHTHVSLDSCPAG